MIPPSRGLTSIIRKPVLNLSFISNSSPNTNPNLNRSISTSRAIERAMSNKSSSSSASSRLSQVSAQMSRPSNSRNASTSTSTSASALRKHDESTSKPVLEFSQGGLRTIMLNRPKALNALNKKMVDLIDQALENFTSSPSCSVIALRGEGRALCSGGDVMAVVTSAASSDENERNKALDFFKSEFELDYKIANLGGGSNENAMDPSKNNGKRSPKHFVAFMDGITMGGGVGLSLHAPFRISTERTMFAMPETGIGYFPDVGVTRVLARLDGKIGMYLGLTGARISGEEAYLTGLATHFIQSSQIDSVLQRLSTLPSDSASDPQVISSAIEEYTSDPFGPDNEKSSTILNSTPFLGEKRVVLDYVFGQPSIEASISCLEELTSENPTQTQASQELKLLGVERISDGIIQFSKETLKTLRTKSPRSLKVTFEVINRARKFTIEDAFKNDMRLATVFCDLSLGRDFHTGVTHTLTKDPETGEKRKGIADWSPERLSQVEDSLIKTLFFGDLKQAQNSGLKMQVPELKLSSPSSSSSSSSSLSDRRRRESELRGKGPLGWEPSFNQFALPSEAEFFALMSGDHPAAGNLKLEINEIEGIIKRRNGGKVAGERKIRDWLARESSKKG